MLDLHPIGYHGYDGGVLWRSPGHFQRLLEQQRWHTLDGLAASFLWATWIWTALLSSSGSLIADLEDEGAIFRILLPIYSSRWVFFLLVYFISITELIHTEVICSAYSMTSNTSWHSSVSERIIGSITMSHSSKQLKSLEIMNPFFFQLASMLQSCTFLPLVLYLFHLYCGAHSTLDERSTHRWFVSVLPRR